MTNIPHATEITERLRRESASMDASFEERCAAAIDCMISKQTYVNIQGIEYGAQMRVKVKLENLGYQIERRDDQRDGPYFLILVP